VKLKPVKLYKDPAYPALGDLGSSKELITGNIPSPWKQKALITAALVAFTALTSPGAMASGEEPLYPAPGQGFHSTRQEQFPPLDEPSMELLAAVKKKALIAPIFIHGGGTGSSGGIAASPLTSLTEAEARTIIEGELKKSGIVFDRHDQALRGAVVEGQDGEAGNRGISIPLEADGLDSRHNLAYEYVPAKSYHRISYCQKGTLTEVNYTVLAESVRKGFENAGTVNAVVFYDPLPRGAHRAEAEKLLREQVRDFIKWAKEKKII